MVGKKPGIVERGIRCAVSQLIVAYLFLGGAGAGAFAVLACIDFRYCRSSACLLYTAIIQWLFETTIEASEALPLLLFIGIGAMIDFGPLLSNPKMMLFGAAAQFGIFITFSLSQMCLRDRPGTCSVWRPASR